MVTWKGVVLIATLVITAWLGSTLHVLIALPPVLICRICGIKSKPGGKELLWHRTIADHVAAMWFSLVAWLLHVFGMRIVGILELPDGSKRYMTPEDWNSLCRPPSGKFTLITANHRTRIDWLLLWAFLQRTRDMLSGHKITLKSSLKKVPFFGWAMQHFRFLFLSRDRKKDVSHIDRVIKHYMVNDEQPSLLIFPEGSDLSRENIEKSQTFAKQNGLPQYRQVLNPRTTGVIQLLQSVGLPNVHQLLDLTIAYREYRPGQRPSEATLLNATLPSHMFVIVKKYAFATAVSKGDAAAKTTTMLPSDLSEEQIAKLITSSFHQKEEVLAEFYSSNPQTIAMPPTEAQGGGLSPRVAPLRGGGLFLVPMYWLAFCYIAFQGPFWVTSLWGASSGAWLPGLSLHLVIGTLCALWTALGGVEELFLFAPVEEESAKTK